MDAVPPPVSRLSANDLTSLATDRGSVPMHIGAVLLLDEEGAPYASDLAAVVAQRLCGIPRLTQRLRRPPPGCGGPCWEAAPGDTSDLVTVSPAPADAIDDAIDDATDDAALVDAAVAEVTRRLPRERPLWRAVVHHDPGGRARSLVVVMHHALADGMGGLAVLAELVDGAAPPPPAVSPAPTTRRELAAEAWTRRWSALRGAPRTVRSLTAGVRELGGLPRARAAPSSLLAPTSPRRCAEVVDVPLSDVIETAHRRHATINDVVLVAVAGALRRLLHERGVPLGEVVVSVPVSGRSAASGSDLGNQVGVLPLTVPLVADPALRLAAVREQRARLGTSAPRASSAAVISVLFRGLAAVGVFAWFIDRQRLVHTFLTNLRGPDQPLHVAGCRIRRVVPVALTPGNTTITFDVLSYAGRLLVSVLYDPVRVPDHGLLRESLEDELTAGL